VNKYKAIQAKSTGLGKKKMGMVRETGNNQPLRHVCCIGERFVRKL